VKKPRIKKILLIDWPALFCVIAIPGSWILGLVFPLLRKNTEFGMFEILTVAVPVSLIAACFLFWRIARIQKLFQHGIALKGSITHIQFSRDRARVEFLYEFNGECFGAWMPLHQNREVLALYVSQEVEILVDKDHPHRAIIRHLFE
jgi:hypothetical protein